jgi:nicotinamidase-related amidase
MSKDNPILKSLIDCQDSCLILIDIQKLFLDKLLKDEIEPLVKRIIWLVKVANILEIPLIVTAEDMDKNGSIIPELKVVLPPNTKIHNKMIFGLAADPDILRCIRDTNRKTAILLGLETDVCVAHSAIGLLEEGYQVVVVKDGTASPGNAHQNGLSRAQSAGAHISDLKSLFYEWMRTVRKCEEFYGANRDYIGDPGIKL